MKKLVSIIFGLFVFLSSAVAADSMVSAYLRGEYVPVSDVATKLKSVGFEILATYDSVKDGKTIVFTNDALENEASKKGRAYVAILRAFVDKKMNTLSITNPIYFGRAFMQNDYNPKVFEEQLSLINKIFPQLKKSSDALEFNDLAGYHFMFSMPYYEDSLLLGSGKNEELLAKLEKNNPVFVLKLKNSILVGCDLKESTKSFVEKIGRANATVLPYTVKIEDGKATALHAKYYLAISYPSLSMGKFMTISDIPDIIESELSKPFN
ncbi:hypothetical protein ACKGJI_08190 [Sulfurospirillum sp. 1307]